MNIANELRLFREDKTSGATALAERAIDVFDAFIADQRARPTTDFAQSIASVARDIVNAQPSMSIMVEPDVRKCWSDPADLRGAASRQLI
jgi:translation initiation factor 2B subunit (eIF-2B alpha/beta/delta family)